MLACMEPDLQLQFDNNHATHDMIVALNDMFQTQARTERFNVSKAFAETKLADGATVGPHMIKIVGYTQRLEKLGFPIGPELATDFYSRVSSAQLWKFRHELPYAWGGEGLE